MLFGSARDSNRGATAAVEPNCAWTGPSQVLYLSNMSLEGVTETIRRKVEGSTTFGSVLKLDMGEAGVVVVDGSGGPARVHNEPHEAECTISASLADVEAIFARTLDPMEAFSLGKLQLDGDLGVAMKLSSIF